MCGDVKQGAYGRKREYGLERSQRGYGSAQQMFCLVYKKDEMKHAGYAILDDLGDPLLYFSAMKETVDMPMEYPGMNVKKQYGFVIPMISGEAALKVQKNHKI